MSGLPLICFLVGISIQILLTDAQLPPRLNIPGALLLQQQGQGQRPPPNRPHRLHQQLSDGPPIPIRIRKPIPNALPISIPIREDSEEQEVKQSFLDEEVAKFSAPSLQQKQPDNDVEVNRPVQFRPERPLNIPQPTRQSYRQDLDDDEEPIQRQAPPQRQQLRQQSNQVPIRQQKPKPVAYQKPLQHLDDDDGRRNRNRKPPVQILRKFRTDNDDGSITWGFENEDGTFKEETIGIDCVIRGKYGYIDPEGTRREYSYEAGNKCDHQLEEEELPEDLPQQQIAPGKQPLRKQYNVPYKQ